jgi:hypothetical protein
VLNDVQHLHLGGCLLNPAITPAINALSKYQSVLWMSPEYVVSLSNNYLCHALVDVLISYMPFIFLLFVGYAC